jgi:hypothetical protein
MTPSPAADRRIVTDCPVCKRTVWFNSVCHHGKIPPPKGDGAEKVSPKPGTGYKFVDGKPPK